MAGRYLKGRRNIMANNVNLLEDGISAILVDTDIYSVDLDNDETQEDIPAAAIISEVVLTGQSLDGPVFRADSATFPNVTGSKVGAVVIAKYSEYYRDVKLLAYLDSTDIGSPDSLPIIPDGTDIVINWDSGENGIFSM